MSVDYFSQNELLFETCSCLQCACQFTENVFSYDLNFLSRVFLITELSSEMLEKQENGAIMCQTSIHCTL